ncbi:hypothetical protein ACQY0O_006148 [Thecaphora frezii]
MSDTETRSSNEPTSAQLVQQVRSIIKTAQSHNKVHELTKRMVRDRLQQHFGVDLNAKKQWLNQVIQDNVNELLSTPDSPAEKKRKKTSPPTSASKSAKATKKGFKSKVTAKHAEEEEEEEEEEEYAAGMTSAKVDAADAEEGEAAGSDKEAQRPLEKDEQPSPRTVAAVAADDDEEEAAERDKEAADAANLSGFSELEDEEPARSPSKKKEQGRRRAPSTSSSATAAGGARAKRRTSTDKPTKGHGSGPAEKLARLKAIVAAAGVRKAWKKLYAAAGVEEEDIEGQCKVVQGVVREEIGITGRCSIAEAKRIRAQREFQDEVAALQSEQPEVSTSRRGSRRGNPTPTATTTAARKDGDEDRGDANEGGGESEDDGPRRKSFRNSLASFAAGLNSDSE